MRSTSLDLLARFVLEDGSVLLKFPVANAGLCIVPATVTRLGEQAFISVPGLTRLTFIGNAPELGTDVFTASDSLTTILYNSSGTGWSSTIGGLTAMPAPLPAVLSHAINSGADSTGFNLTFTSVEGFSYTVQSSRNLHTWSPAQTFTGTGGSIRFSDSFLPGQALPARKDYRVVQN